MAGSCRQRTRHQHGRSQPSSLMPAQSDHEHGQHSSQMRGSRSEEACVGLLDPRALIRRELLQLDEPFKGWSLSLYSQVVSNTEDGEKEGGMSALAPRTSEIPSSGMPLTRNLELILTWLVLRVAARSCPVTEEAAMGNTWGNKVQTGLLDEEQVNHPALSQTSEHEPLTDTFSSQDDQIEEFQAPSGPAERQGKSSHLTARNRHF